MAQYIIPVYFSNTFGDLVRTANNTVNELNNIGFKDWDKTSGTFSISTSDKTGFKALTDAIFYKAVKIEGVGSSLTVENDAEIKRKLTLSAGKESETLVSTGISVFANGVSDYVSYINQQFSMIVLGRTVFGSNVHILQTANVNQANANTLIINLNTTGNTAQFSGKVTTANLVSNSFIFTSLDITADRDQYVSQNSYVGDISFTSIVQANNRVNTGNLSITNSTFGNYIQANSRTVTGISQANTRVITDTLEANTRALTGILQANTRVITSTLEANSRTVTGISQANTRVITSTLEANSRTVTGISQANTRVITDTLEANSRVLTGTLQANSNIFTDSIISNTRIHTITLQADTILANANVVTDTIQSNTRTITSLLQANTRAVTTSLQANLNIFTDTIQSNTRMVTSIVQANNIIFANTIQANSNVLTSSVVSSSNVISNMITANTQLMANSIRANIDLFVANTIFSKNIGVLDSSGNPSTEKLYVQQMLANDGVFKQRLLAQGGMEVQGVVGYTGNNILLSANTPVPDKYIPGLGGLNVEILVNRTANSSNNYINQTGSDASITWIEGSNNSGRWAVTDIANTSSSKYSRIYTNILREKDISNSAACTSNIMVPSSNMANAISLHANTAYNWANGAITIGTTPLYLNRTNTAIGGITTLSVTGTSFSETVQANTNLNYSGTFTGGTGTINLGSGQFYKDAGTGFVGIGTTNPGTSLQVQGGIRARGGVPGTGGVNNNGYAFTGSGDTDSGLFSSADGRIELYTNGTERLRIDAVGNIGIGFNSTISTVKFAVQSTSEISRFSSTSNDGFIRVSETGGDAILGSTSSSGFVGSSTATTFALRTSNANRLIINATGNIGIGKAPTTNLLDINGTVNATKYTGSFDGNMRGAFDSTITWNNGVNILIPGESSFDLNTAGAILGIYDSGGRTGYAIRYNYAEHLRLAENGCNIYVYGSRLFNDVNQQYVYHATGGAASSYPEWRINISGNSATTSKLDSNSRNYSREWIELPNHTGLYSTLNNAHFYPSDGTYGSWKIIGSRNGWSGLEFHDSSVSLMANSNDVGFHKNGQGWQLRWNAGVGYVYKGINGGSTQATILDSVNYNSWAMHAPGYQANQNLRTTDPVNFDFVTTRDANINGRMYALGSQSSPIGTPNGGLGGIEVRGPGGTTAAFMSFHRPGAFATYLGLDTDNRMKVGGWSYGANAYEIALGDNRDYIMGSKYVTYGVREGTNAELNMRVVRNLSCSPQDGMYIGYGNSGSGYTRIFGGGATSGALEKRSDHTYEPGYFLAPKFVDSNDQSFVLDPNGASKLSSAVFTGSIQVSQNNTTGGGILIGDDGDIVDLNDGWCSMRFSSGVRIYSANRGGSSVIGLGSNGNLNATGSGTFGFTLSSGTSASIGTTLSVGSNATVNGSLTVGSGGASYIHMVDTDEGTRIIHCNSNRIGFLNQSNGWGSYCNDDGSWVSDAYMSAPIYYNGSGQRDDIIPNSFMGTNDNWQRWFSARCFIQGLDRNRFAREANGGTLRVGSIYGIYTWGGSVGMYLPGGASAGDTIEFHDFHGGWGVDGRVFTVYRNGYLINHIAEDLICDIRYGSFKLVYVWDRWNIA